MVNLDEMTLDALRTAATQLKIKGRAGLNKKQLKQAITKHYEATSSPDAPAGHTQARAQEAERVSVVQSEAAVGPGPGVVGADVGAPPMTAVDPRRTRAATETAQVRSQIRGLKQSLREVQTQVKNLQISLGLGEEDEGTP